MGMQKVYQQSCLHKQRFKSFEAAQKRVRLMARQGKMITEKNIYSCTFCKGWHLGHSWKFDDFLKRSGVEITNDENCAIHHGC